MDDQFINNTLFKSCCLIEDDPSHALLVKRALRDLCSDIHHYESLSAALAQAVAKKPEIIVTDLNLPDSSHAANIGRLQEMLPECPIIVLTSSTSLEDAVQAMKLGAVDFIVKNFDSSFKEILHLSLSRIHASVAVHREKRKLQREMEALRLAIENSNDGLAVTDSLGGLVYANRSFHDFVKICGGGTGTLFSIVGDSVESMERLRSSIADKFSSLSAGAVWHTEVHFVEDKNLAYDLSLSVIRSAMDDGEDPRSASGAIGNECVVWVRNVTEDKRREKFQREILSTTTHDLKGPLGAISISAELLAPLASKDQKAGEIIKRIASSALSASNLIEEFLSARRIKEGTFILKPLKQDLVQVFSEVVGGFEPAASVKHISLSFSSESQRIEWCVDRMGMSRVLSNLVSNAIKFTPKDGKVSVQLFVTNSDLHIAVTDTGSGMEPSEVNRVFERFTRLEKHSGIPGSGIGLFVVKSIVVAHGGKIEVTSQPGKGTTFDVVLPENPPVNQRGELISLDFA